MTRAAAVVNRRCCGEASFALRRCRVARRAELRVRTPVRPLARIGEIAAELVEHAEIVRLLRSFASPGPSRAALVARLARTLREHLVKEEEVLFAFAELTPLPVIPAQVLALSLTLVLSFFGHRLFTFRRPAEAVFDPSSGPDFLHGLRRSHDDRGAER